MLQLTRLSGPVFALNPDLIERAEATPDTVVTLVNGSRYVIRESLDELVELCCLYRARIIAIAHAGGEATPPGMRRTTAPAAPTSGAHPHATPKPVPNAPMANVVALRPGDK